MENLVEKFYRDGYVVIENVLPVELVMSINKSFMESMSAKIEKFKIAPVNVTDGRYQGNSGVKIDFQPEGGNHDLNRWNMHLPTKPEFINDQLLANPQVLAVIKELLGNDPVAFLLASDTPYPQSGFQSIHQDFPRFGLTVNIPLVDITEDNAPLEVWPGSHMRGNVFREGEMSLTATEIKEITRVPGQRLLLKAGSICIRDQRLVHRGTANTGQEPRPCLSIWYKSIEEYSLRGLTIPVPHRSVANSMAKVALWIREKGRGKKDHITNKKLLNWGNLFGRIVEETSASDRDYRREIPLEVWNKCSSQTKRLLRYASVENQKNPNRSVIGSVLLVLAGFVFIFVTFILIMVNLFKGKELIRNQFKQTFLPRAISIGKKTLHYK